MGLFLFSFHLGFSDQIFAQEIRKDCDSCRFSIHSLENPFSTVGQWLFTRDDHYQNKNPHIDTSHWKLVKTPGPWKKFYEDGKNFQVGWYRAELSFNPELIGTEVVFLVDAYMGKLNVYLDGQEIYKRTGQVNTQRYYSIQPVPVRFKITQSKHTLAFRVDTFLMTGVYQLPFELRKFHPDDLKLNFFYFWGGELRLISASILAVFGLFFLLIYKKTRYKLYLYAALAGIIFFPFLGLPTDMFMRIFPPQMLLPLHYVGLSTVYFHYLFSQYFYKFTPRFNRYTLILYGALTLMFPILAIYPNLDLFQHLRVVFLLFSQFLALKMLHMLYRGTVAKKPGAKILMFSALFYALSSGHDLLLALGIIQSVALVFLAVLIMTANILGVASTVFANTFLENKQLAQNLQVMNDGLEDQIKQRTQELKGKTDSMKGMLDHLLEGIFTFGKDYRIHPEYSQTCLEFFGGSPDKLNPLPLLFSTISVTAEQLRETEDPSAFNYPATIKDSFDMLFDDPETFNILEDLLPREITLRHHIFTLKYRMIAGNSSEQHRVMVIITDITKEREMQARIATEEERNGMIVKVALDRNGFLEFLKELDGVIQRVDFILTQPVSAIDTNELFRHYHTLKGGAAVYGLKSIVNQVHQIEDRLELYRNGQNPLATADLPDLQKKTEELKQTLSNTLEELSCIITEEDIHAKERIYPVSAGKIKYLHEFLNHKVSQEMWQQIQPVLETLKKQPIASVLRKYATTAEGLAEKLGKKITVRLEGLQTEVLHENMAPLFSSLVHLIRNSVDHGLETPDIRSMLGKSEVGNLHLSARQEAKQIRITVSDDGGGIDPEGIRNIALKKNLLSQEQASVISDQDLLHLIFMPGFSTKDSVTTLSGRGVGMDAIKTAVEYLDGNIDIKSTPGQGTTIEITVPHYGKEEPMLS